MHRVMIFIIIVVCVTTYYDNIIHVYSGGTGLLCDIIYRVSSARPATVVYFCTRSPSTPSANCKRDQRETQNKTARAAAAAAAVAVTGFLRLIRYIDIYIYIML